MRGGQPIVPALKGQPTIAALQAVANAVSLCRRMMGIHNGRDARQRRRVQLPKQAVNIRGSKVEVKVRIHLSEVCRQDITPPKLGFWERNPTFEELRGGGG